VKRQGRSDSYATEYDLEVIYKIILSSLIWYDLFNIDSILSQQKRPQNVKIDCT